MSARSALPLLVAPGQYDPVNEQQMRASIEDRLRSTEQALSIIDDNAVTSISAQYRVLGRNSSGAGDVEEVTFSQFMDWVGSAAHGDILYRGATGWSRLGAGTSGHFLRTNGAAANPSFAALPTLTAQVATRTALKALSTSTYTTAILTEGTPALYGRMGHFIFQTGNFSSQVTLDTQEGIYVKADDTATTAGCWVRVVDGDYSVHWFGAVGDGTTNDATAINAAYDVAGIGGRVAYGPYTYAVSSTITHDIDGLTAVGRNAADVFSVSPTTTQGTVLKWTGASGGYLYYFGCVSGGSADLAGGGIENIQFDGNALAIVCVHFRSCAFSTFKNLKARNPKNDATSSCFYLDSDVQARSGVNALFRCNWYNTALVSSTLGQCIRITGASDETSGRHPSFVSFHGLNITHDDGDAIYIDSADTIAFYDAGVSKVSGGTGRAVAMIPRADLSVSSIKFDPIYLGSNDTPTMIADAGASGSQCCGIIAVVGGVDAAPTITASNGASIDYVTYLGRTSAAGSSEDTKGPYTVARGLYLSNVARTDTAILDYYKERTGTVTVTINGSSSGITTSLAAYSTTRIGNVVHYNVRITLTNKGAGGGANALLITGLPYNAQDGEAGNAWLTGVTAGVGDTMLSCLASTTTIIPYKMVTGNLTQLVYADITNTTSMVFSGTYVTDTATA